MSKRVAQYKVEQITEKLLAPLEKQKTEAKSKIIDICTKIAIDRVPKEVLDFQAKYPSTVVFRGSVLMKVDEYGFHEWVGLKEVPKVVEGKRVDEDETGNLSHLFHTSDSVLKAIKEYVDLKTRHTLLKKKISCNISGLGTYAKVKKNFPEAYRELMILDDEPIEEGGDVLCDKTENIRAELSAIVKK